MHAPLKRERRRILHLWFPHLSTERLLRQRLGRSWRSLPRQGRPPLVVSRQESNTQRIAALDEQASRLKLKPGMGIADARAMYPAIEVVEADPEADRRLLEALADWCDRYTPLVAFEGSDGLFLDITGCAHLFGGEEAMLDGMLARFLEQGFAVSAGLASTPGAAWAAARFSRSPGRFTILQEGDERAFMQDLPLAALRVEARTIALVESVGLRTVGMVAAAPRAPFARRFGAMMVLRLDQAFGEVEEAVSPRLPVPSFSIERHLAEPIGLVEDIERLVHLLAGSLKRDLDRRGEGARLFELLLFRVDGAVTRIQARASLPMREPGPVGRLFHERLAALGAVLDPGYGFDLVRLAAFETAAIDTVQADLAGESAIRGEDIALFADRVCARLGRETILSPVMAESHLPERAAALVPGRDEPERPARHDREDGSPPSRRAPERPLRLFARPEPIDVPVTDVPEGPPLNFRWRRSMHRVARAEGPERISPEWWLNRIPEAEEDKTEPDKEKREAKREAAERMAVAVETARRTRDYFRIEDTEGRRFWLYREGLYTPEAQPRWFVQGLFA